MTLLRLAAGALIATLPSRYWRDGGTRVAPAPLTSGVLTLIAGMALGIPGFFDFLQEFASANNAAAVQVAGRHPATYDGNAAAVLRGAPTALTALALPLFLFTTPLGLLTLYLAGSGLLRALSALVADGFGDPLLTGVDAVIRRARRSRRDRLARRRRETLEGPEMPDRIMGAAHLGIANADFVIVAARRKPEWDEGTVVQTADGAAYRVGRIEERTVAGRLRTLYPLSEHQDLEVFRRLVRYELPPGRRS
jgi:hypothetical protein